MVVPAGWSRAAGRGGRHAAVTVACAADPPLLDVSFGGSFSAGDAYTAATGETMAGALTRRSGGESVDARRGAVLPGGSGGLTFVPGSPVCGGDTQRSFVVEVEFTPDGDQAAPATVLSVGGTLFARYAGSQLRYGFSVLAGGEWTDVVRTVPAPVEGRQHVLSLAYEPGGGGATLHAFLDGDRLPAAVGTAAPATWSPGAAGTAAGIGNEVHPGAAGCGLAGSVRRVRISRFAGAFTPGFLALQRVQLTSTRVRVGFEGTVRRGTYRPGEGEAVTGALRVTGGTITAPGRMRLAGADSGIDWDAGPLGADPTGTGLLAETVVAPAILRPGQPVLEVLGAAALTALSGRRLRLTAGELCREFALPVPQRRSGLDHQHLALEVAPGDDGTLAVTVRAGATVAGPYRVAAPPSPGRTVRWLRGASGEVYGAAVTSYPGGAAGDARVLGALPCVATEYPPAQRLATTPGECLTSLAAKASALRPSRRQLDWQRLGQTAFLHFGINTFTGREWGTGTEDPNLFAPTDLDTDQWARTLRDSGFTLAILVVKHHDGFVLYPSRYTGHGVASSSWRDGTGDVLREFTDSMRSHGLKVGVYLSPADENQYHDGVYANGSAHTGRTIPTPVPGDDRAARLADGSLPTFHLTADDYGAYMLDQLYEVLTEYGPIDQVWFDGAQGRIPPDKVERYDFASWYSLIRSLAPHAVISVTGPDVRWVGNESGIAREDEWSVLPTITGADGAPGYALGFAAPDQGGTRALLAGRDAGATELSWWPAECDVSLHDGWFWHPGQAPKSVAQLVDIHHRSVGRNAVLLLNVPPDTDGHIAAADAIRLAEWRAELRRLMPTDLARGARIDGDGTDPGAVLDGRDGTAWTAPARDAGTLTLTLPETVVLERIELGEDVRHGQRVERAVLEVPDGAGGWSTIAAVGTIGMRRLVVLDHPVRTGRLRLRVTASRAPAHLERISLYHAAS